MDFERDHLPDAPKTHVERGSEELVGWILRSRTVVLKAVMAIPRARAGHSIPSARAGPKHRPTVGFTARRAVDWPT